MEPSLDPARAPGRRSALAQARSTSREGIEEAISIIAPSGERVAGGTPGAGLRFGDWLSRLAATPTVSMVAPALDGARLERDGEPRERPWLWYELTTADAASRAGLAVGDDGTYELVLARSGSTSGPARCFCSGRLDDDQLAAIDALFTPELLEACALHGAGPAEPGPARRVSLRPRRAPLDDHRFELGARRARQGETATLVKTLDGIVAELFARGEYCSDEDRAVAELGDWVRALET